jgi:hypothetical protein
VTTWERFDSQVIGPSPLAVDAAPGSVDDDAEWCRAGGGEIGNESSSVKLRPSTAKALTARASVAVPAGFFDS